MGRKNGGGGTSIIEDLEDVFGGLLLSSEVQVYKDFPS
jgi:hypothetical protein